MDDSLDSVNSNNESKTLQMELSDLWNEANMQAHKWFSNSEEVLKSIKPGEKRKETETHVLGVIWDTSNDTLRIEWTSEKMIDTFTKRNALCVASMFDPLGLISPIVIQMKVLIQDMWLEKVEWDETISEKLQMKMKSWLEDLSNLSKLSFPRCIKPIQNHQKESYTLHIFVDGSEYAYAAVAYMRTSIPGKEEPVF